MNDQNLAMLRYAAAVPWPLKFALRTADGAVQEHEFESSFVIVGRGSGCDVQISDQAVSFRHTYLQAIGGQVACIDLLSTTGIRSGGTEFQGWMSPGQVLEIGKSRLELLGDHWTNDPTLKPPLDFRPRDEQRAEYGTLPQVELELRNTSQKGKKWPINRVITLVGRDDGCRITVMDDRISRVQCALLLLPSGLWVIDLLGKGGVQVNGQPCRCSLLATGSELTIGPYQLAPHYPQAALSLEQAAAAQWTQTDFLTRPNKILSAELYHDTVIVAPQSNSQMCFYQDIDVEARRIIDLMKQKGFRNVVIDFSQTDQAGHMVLEVLMSVCRAATGRAAMCGANSTTYESLQANPLFRLFYHYHTRQEALQAIYHPVQA